MHFYLDETLSNTIAAMARERGLDVISSHDCGRDGSSDEEQLTLAAGEGRCIVTQNGSGPDFHTLTATFQEQSLPHAGVLIVPPSLNGSEYTAIVERLAQWERAYPTGLVPYFFGYLNALT